MTYQPNNITYYGLKFDPRTAIKKFKGNYFNDPYRKTSRKLNVKKEDA